MDSLEIKLDFISLYLQYTQSFKNNHSFILFCIFPFLAGTVSKC